VSILIDKFKELCGDDTHITLCGEIKLVDDRHNEFRLFDQEEGSAKVVDISILHSDILQGHRLTHPILLPETLTCHMYLKNGKKPIINESFKLCFSDDVKYDQEQDYECQSGFAYVKYTIFQYAVFASVKVLVDGTESCEDLDKVSCGTISAAYKLGNEIGSRTFYYDPYPSEPYRTSWFAVPSYSSFLELKAELEIDGIRSTADFRFRVCDGQREMYWQSAKVGADLSVCVELTWRHPFYLYDSHKPERPADEPERPAIVYKYDIKEKKSWVLENSKASDWHLVEFESNVPEEPEQRWPDLSPSPPSTCIDRALVEIYSVSVYAYGKRPLSLYGTIKYSKMYSTMGEKFYMFKRDKGHTVKVNSGDNLPLINADRCYLGGAFEISLNLKDSRGHKIKGSVVWDYDANGGWYYRLISSVVPSRVGYAAVQYSLFPDAIQAKLKIVFVSPTTKDTKICGRICTRYENFKYFSHSEKIYESVCFERSHSNCVEISGGKEIPLSKYAIVAPLGVHLIVNVDLCVWDGWEVTLLRATTEIFQPPDIRDKTEISAPQEIRENLYGVDVSMEWNGHVRSCKRWCTLGRLCHLAN
jgi:hypothetical protein